MTFNCFMEKCTRIAWWVYGSQREIPAIFSLLPVPFPLVASYRMLFAAEYSGLQNTSLFFRSLICPNSWRYTLCILCWFSDSRLSHSPKRQLYQLLLRILNAQITSLSPRFVLTLFYFTILLTNVYLHRHDNKTLGYFLVDFFLQMTNRCFSNDRLTNINRSGRWDVIHEATTLHAVVEKEIVVRLVLQRNCL